jgi:hypothetical protein
MVRGGFYSDFLFSLIPNFRYRAIVDKPFHCVAEWVVRQKGIFAHLRRLHNAVCITCRFIGVLHVVDGKGDKQRTSILPQPALQALKTRFKGQDVGYIFEGRDHGHISTRQIQRLLDGVAEEARTPRDATGRSEAAEEEYSASSEAQLQSMVT